MGYGYGFTKRYTRRIQRKHYKQIMREHDSWKHCECKDCTEAYEYYIYMREDLDFYPDHHLQSGFY